jgi:hypothetical protein
MSFQDCETTPPITRLQVIMNNIARTQQDLGRMQGELREIITAHPGLERYVRDTFVKPRLVVDSDQFKKPPSLVDNDPPPRRYRRRRPEEEDEVPPRRRRYRATDDDGPEAA